MRIWELAHLRRAEHSMAHAGSDCVRSQLDWRDSDSYLITIRFVWFAFWVTVKIASVAKQDYPDIGISTCGSNSDRTSSCAKLLSHSLEILLFSAGGRCRGQVNRFTVAGFDHRWLGLVNWRYHLHRSQTKSRILWKRYWAAELDCVRIVFGRCWSRRGRPGSSAGTREQLLQTSRTCHLVPPHRSHYLSARFLMASFREQTFRLITGRIESAYSIWSGPCRACKLFRAYPTTTI